MELLKTIFRKKIRASSLTEVLIATTILLVVFAIALTTLNNIMIGTVQKDTQQMHTQVEKLIYQYKNEQLKIPSAYKEDNFILSVQKITQNKIAFVVFSVTNTETKKSVLKKQLYYETD
jgi:type II secretory pathway pseudopilin PulG